MIDTLARIRSQGRSTASAYDSDYAALAALKDLGDLHHVSVITNHHTRKARGDDEDNPFETISGTLGLNGAVDAVCVLKRGSNQTSGRLYVEGRDIEEQTINLTWSKTTCLWEKSDDQSTQNTPEEQRVPDYLREIDGEIRIAALAEALGKGFDATKKNLQRMEKKGLVLNRSGNYSIDPSSVPHVPGVASPIADEPPGGT